MKKLAAVLAFALTSFMVTPALIAPAQAADDDYTAGVRTSCNLTVPAVVSVGRAPRIRIHVQPNAPAEAAGTRAAARADRPTGSVTVSIRKGGVGIFSKTVDYNGSPVTIQGPVLTQPGRYQVHGTFRTADGSVFKSCQSDTSFELATNNDGPDVPGPNPGVQNPGGLLPDTGGPNVVWLLLGLTLVGGGGGLVFAAKKRPRGPLYDV
ncbi:MAG TPA: LPXTG cell wall anchor domain-containing protein [Nocardioides sp.]|nr:LPXTG cell wall anchor domain-containing protein [Nocardioides sp.]